MVDEFVDRARQDPDFPRAVLVHLGTAEQGAAWFGDFGDAVQAIADPDGDLYAAVAVERGGMREMFGLRPWQRGIQAFFKGHFIGKKVGDPWTLPTLFLVEDGTVVWEHRGTHAGDHPDIDVIQAGTR